MSNESGYEGYCEWKQWNRMFDPKPHESDLFQREFEGITVARQRLLDIGFGSGALLGWARANGAHIAGIELQDELRRAAIEHGVTTYNSLAAVPDSAFEVITAFDVLEHIPREQLIDVLTNIRRISTPEARIVIRVPNCQSAIGLINYFGDATHVTMLSGPIIEQLCRQTGLRVLHIREGKDPVLPTTPLRKLIRPFQTLTRKLVKLAFRFAWSSGTTPLTSNVTVIAVPDSRVGQ